MAVILKLAIVLPRRYKLYGKPLHDGSIELQESKPWIAKVLGKPNLGKVKFTSDLVLLATQNTRNAGTRRHCWGEHMPPSKCAVAQRL